MRLAIISDTHLPRGNRRLPQACVDELTAADRILHAGDLTTPAILADLERLGPPVVAVAGNVDVPALHQLLAHEVQLTLDGVTVAMVHDAGPASGRLERMRARFPAADVVIFGHSHIPLHERLAVAGDGPHAAGVGVTREFQIFNPGSPTDRRRQPRHSMGVADIEHGRISLRHVFLGH